MHHRDPTVDPRFAVPVLQALLGSVTGNALPGFVTPEVPETPEDTSRFEELLFPTTSPTLKYTTTYLEHTRELR